MSRTYEKEIERLEETEFMDDHKEAVSSRYNRTDAHMKSPRLWQHAQDMYRFQSDVIPALEGTRFYPSQEGRIVYE